MGLLWAENCRAKTPGLQGFWLSLLDRSDCYYYHLYLFICVCICHSMCELVLSFCPVSPGELNSGLSGLAPSAFVS